MTGESGMDAVPPLEARTERIRLVEERIFGTLARLRGVHPFIEADHPMIEDEFVDVTGARFESQDGEPGIIPFNTDGTEVNYEVLDKVGRFNWQQGGDTSVLGFVDTAGHFRVGLANHHHTSLLHARGYMHDPELAIPFTHGETPRDGGLAQALIRTQVHPLRNQ